MPSNNAITANSLAQVNTANVGDRLVIVTNPTSNTNWRLKAISSSDLFANSTHDVKAANLQITYNTTPANSTANAVAGLVWYDNNYIYVAIANNSIKRVALSSF